MELVRIVGWLFVAIGFSMLFARIKQKRGAETWEGAHRIKIKPWMWILPLIIGLIFSLGNNFHFSVTGEDGNKVIDASWTPTPRPTERIVVKPVEEDKKASEKNGEQGNVGKVVLSATHTPVPTATPVLIKEVYGEQECQIPLGETSISVTFPEEFNAKSVDGAVICRPAEDFEVVYKDSLIKVGDVAAVEEYYQRAKRMYGVDEIETYQMSISETAPLSYAGSWAALDKEYFWMLLAGDSGEDYLEIQASGAPEYFVDLQLILNNFGLTF